MAKLVICFVHRDDASRVVSALRESDLRVTELRSEGGFLRAGNSTLMLGVEDDQLPLALSVIDRNCQRRTEQVPVELLGGMDPAWLPTEVTHGGATVLVLPIEAVHRF
ncbi:MAG: hypothetical protein QOH61_288 [Chloroflexota bacterium]|nr:hypothetical protein [Chloroflexota bacterium]